ncbi:thiol-disulfide oxidoreductase DCC family protein [Shimia thalassica]|uniref:thiol-disulfide oxidoreductase DCC family protein n=1 Tax=Shimia thalassica TaxID=1715693 RepID=UPI002735220F|nr:DUF393 domain-containing protein [Shimia thalassica]MDP2520096.1 DUF393 domain-containing protein [Shimia thalassica]
MNDPTRPPETETSATKASPDGVTIYYDGSCPLCTAEIDYYKRADTEQKLSLVDVSSERFQGDEQLSRADAMARFHIRMSDGRQVSGARAFVEVWRALPSWRWLARLSRIPGVVQIQEVAYRGFLHLRPLVVRSYTRFTRKAQRSNAR